MATPRHHTPRSDRPTRGASLRVIAETKRAPLMPWQERAGDVALEFDPDTGLYRYGIVVVSVPRQSGKTKLESDVADHRCLQRPRARVWLAMQNGKTADSWMREEHFTNLSLSRAFRGKYTESRRAGEVGVKWGNHSTFLTFPPKRDALHSKQADLAFIDEAWAHNAETGADIRQAVRPTMATRPGAQLWIVSTMGDDSSTFLDDYITMARESLGNPASRVCFIDYGIPDDADAEDLEVIAAHHPAYGHTIGMQTLIDAREEFGLDVAGFARAYGNRATRTKEIAIPAAVWTAAGRPRPAVPDRAGLGLDATPSGSHYAIASAWRAETTNEDQKIKTGDAMVEVLDAGLTSRETPHLLAQLARARRVPITVDRAALGALELLDAVARIAPDVEIRYLTMAEYASATGIFMRGAFDDTLHHFNQPELTGAVEVAATRDLGDGGIGWRRVDSAGQIHPLVAATVALKGFDLLPRARRITRVISATAA